MKSLRALTALVVFVFVDGSLLLAQQPDLPATITWSEETDSPGNTVMEGVIAPYAGGIYTLRRL